MNTYTKKFLVLAFYLYTPVEEAEEFAALHLDYCRKLGLKGRIYIADEGINGTVSGTIAVCEKYMNHLRAIPQFTGIEFKIHEADEIVIQKIHVRYKNEIVNSGLKELGIDPSKKTGRHIKPLEFKNMKDNKNVVVLDVRSSYETTLGRFKNALTLDMETFREFPEKVKELDHLKDKTVVTYCTGGIKCEKASAFLIERGFNDVYQLKGGILNYGKEAGGEDFEGKCYVFDGRVAIDINSVNPTVISACIHCGKKESRMLNCADAICNEQVVMCEECGWKYEGACSRACMNTESKRAYNGTGYYVKNT